MQMGLTPSSQEAEGSKQGVLKSHLLASDPGLCQAAAGSHHPNSHSAQSGGCHHGPWGSVMHLWMLAVSVRLTDIPVVLRDRK